MANSKHKPTDKADVIAVNIDLPTKQGIAIEEIERAVALHLEGEVPYTVRHRPASATNCQQVQVETIHGTADGKKFRVVTQYDEAVMFVDLVDELRDRTTSH